MVTLFTNARIYTGKDEDIFFGELLVKDNKIIFVGNKYLGNEKIDKVIDVSNNLLMPGFKNAHAHCSMTFLRSASDDMDLQKWLFDCCFPLEAKLIESDIYDLSKIAFIESIQSGITGSFEYYFANDEIKRAAEDVGLRVTRLVTLTPTIPEHRSTEDFLKENKEDELVTVRFGCHAEYTNNPSIFKRIKELQDKYNVPFFTHCSETKFEVEDCKKRNNGLTPVEYLNSFGLFDHGGAIFHGVYLSDNDLKILKEHNISIITCPGSNAKLASGIADISKYKEYGINIGLGTDGPASNNSIDMFKEMYLASVLQKLKYNNPAQFDGEYVLKMATVNSARAIGFNDCDVLEEGKYADIIMIDLSSPSMQPLHNIKKNIVYAGSKNIVKMTMVNGQILYMDNKFYIDEDVNKVYERANKIVKDIFARK